MTGKTLTMALALLFFLCAQMAAQSLESLEPPLPKDLKIEAPGTNVPTKIAQFSGIWEGTWDHHMGRYGGMGVKIAIEKIDPPELSAIYSWGMHPWGSRVGGWVRVKGVIAGEMVVLKWGGRGQKENGYLSDGW